VDWFHLVQDWDQWRVVVNTVMNLRFQYKEVNLLTSRVTISFSNGLYSMELMEHQDIFTSHI